MRSGAAVVLDGGALGSEQVVAVARDGVRVEIGGEARGRMARARAVVEGLSASLDPVYGVSTGFGSLATVAIPPERRRALQAALVRSHAAGMGAPVEREVVRAMALLRAATFARGYSGVRPGVADALVALLNAGITPVVPEYGSVGCSGDLAPLSHVALTLLGEGEVLGADGRPVAAGEALAGAGLAPIALSEKEGLALVNGTDGMLGMLVLACADLRDLLRAADVAAALSIQALLGTDRTLAPELLALRPHPGQADSAANLRALLAGSALVRSAPRVQDAYSLRCAPQVAGAARDALGFAETVAGRELAAAIDNPVILPDGRVTSTGNFHGAPLALACDHLAIAAASVGAIAERRVDRLLDATRSHGLPPFLADDPGVDSGLMLAQYTAAALVAENRRLAAPASVDSLPTSALQEDHNSMGWGAARKLRTLLVNLRRILAVELLCAARGVALRAPREASPASVAVCDRVREVAGGPGPDRWLAPQLAAVEKLLAGGQVVAAVEEVAGPLR